MKPLNININVEAIDALLPQTQCGDCRYRGCKPYAQAIYNGDVALNQCLPGGIDVLTQLGALLQQDISTDLFAMKIVQKEKTCAVIREDLCIGCTKCIQACPVDAIFGAAKQMHTVISSECTGCRLCVEPCPMDCIDLIPADDPHYARDHARQRFQARELRLGNIAKQQQQIHFAAKNLPVQTNEHAGSTKKTVIAAAIARMQAKKNTSPTR